MPSSAPGRPESERGEFAEDGVGESLLFTDILEQARGHATAEKIIENGSGETAFIGQSDRGNTDADVDLLEVALGFESDGRSGEGMGSSGLK